MTILQIVDEIIRIKQRLSDLYNWEGDDIDWEIRRLERRSNELRAALAKLTIKLVV